MASVELSNLTKTYGGVAVVDRVSLAIAPGTLVCLLGPSGCGKTTTLRMIAGFVEPDAGEIRVGGALVSAPGATLPPERRNMAMIFQSYALWPHMTVAENILYGLKLRKLDRAVQQAKLDAMLAITQLAPLAGRYPGELSGGQQQRVALARALVVEPEILLLDEPLSNLDANLREEMRFEVRRLHDTCGITSIYVTHDQSEAMATADLICVMRAGRIEQVGAPEEIYERPRSEFVARFIGASNVIRARTLDRSHVEIGGARLRINGDTTSGETAIAIRQHDMALTTAPPPQSDNVVAATVVRQAFVGAHRDYMVEIAGGARLRVLAPAEVSIETGRAVFLHLPPERCRALAS